MFTPALFPMIRRGEAERGRGSREVEGEERPGGGDSEGEEGGKEVTVTPEAIPLTRPRSWEQIAHSESFSWKKKMAL